MATIKTYLFIPLNKARLSNAASMVILPYRCLPGESRGLTWLLCDRHFKHFIMVQPPPHTHGSLSGHYFRGDGWEFIKGTLITIRPVKMALLIGPSGGNDSLKVLTFFWGWGGWVGWCMCLVGRPGAILRPERGKEEEKTLEKETVSELPADLLYWVIHSELASPSARPLCLKEHSGQSFSWNAETSNTTSCWWGLQCTFFFIPTDRVGRYG